MDPGVAMGVGDLDGERVGVVDGVPGAVPGDVEIGPVLGVVGPAGKEMPGMVSFFDQIGGVCGVVVGVLITGTVRPDHRRQVAPGVGVGGMDARGNGVGDRSQDPCDQTVRIVFKGEASTAGLVHQGDELMIWVVGKGLTQWCFS